MVFEVVRTLRPETPRQFDIAGDDIGNGGRSRRRIRHPGQSLVGGAVRMRIAARGPACAMARGLSAGSPSSRMAPPVGTAGSSAAALCPAASRFERISRKAARAASG